MIEEISNSHEKQSRRGRKPDTKETVAWILKHSGKDKYLDSSNIIDRHNNYWDICYARLHELSRYQSGEFKSMNQELDANTWDKIATIHFKNRYTAAHEAEEMWNLEYSTSQSIISSLISIQRYVRNLPQKDKPKYIFWIGYLSNRLKKIWFTISDIPQHRDQVISYKSLDTKMRIHPADIVKHSLDRVKYTCRRSVLKLIENSPNLQDLPKSRKWKSQVRSHEEALSVKEKFSPEDIQMAWIDTDAFLQIDFNKFSRKGG